MVRNLHLSKNHPKSLLKELINRSGVEFKVIPTKCLRFYILGVNRLLRHQATTTAVSREIPTDYFNQEFNRLDTIKTNKIQTRISNMVRD